MKNSNRTGVGSLIRRSAAILLIFAALATPNASKAADIQNSHSENRTNIELTELSNHGGPLGLSQLLWGTVCYTPFGAFPMAFPMPVGSACHVNTYSGVLYGSVGL